MSLLIDAPTTINEALTALGWQQHGPLEYSVRRGSRRVTLSGHYRTTDWMHFSLLGDGVDAIAPSRVFIANSRMPGPAKFVRVRSNTACLRADLPTEMLAAQEEIQLGMARTSSPLRCWAEDITFIATGQTERADITPAAPEAVAAALSDAGWVAAAENDRVRVTTSLPGLFGHIVIQSSVAGTRVWAELARLADWPDLPRRAALELAQAANERLHLVRLAMLEQSPAETLIAELCIGSARVPGIWLTVALECVQAAVSMCARETAALRDPNLAELILDRADDA